MSIDRPDIEQRYYTKQDMARRYGVSPLTIWRWEKANKIPKGAYIHQKRIWPPQKVRLADEMLLSSNFNDTCVTK